MVNDVFRVYGVCSLLLLDVNLSVDPLQKPCHGALGRLYCLGVIRLCDIEEGVKLGNGCDAWQRSRDGYGPVEAKEG